MPELSPIAVASLVDSIATIICQAYQLARTRLASAASPVLRLVCQRDHAIHGGELLRRELAILRAQRQQMPSHKRHDYRSPQRLAILQLKRLRGWSVGKTARRFVVHPNTIRAWIKAAEGRGNISLLENAVAWNRIDDAVRWTAHELRRLCPQPELGTRSIARQLVRAGVAISRSTVQRVMREAPPIKPSRPRRSPMAVAEGVEPHDLLRPQAPNHVWHVDMTCLQIFWIKFTLAAVLDGFSRKLLKLRVFARTPRQSDLARFVGDARKEFGSPEFLITDHGTQFRRRFHAAMESMDIRHVKGRVRAPYLNGKMERAFRTFRIWWSVVLCGFSRSGIQRRVENYGHWYNHHCLHSAISGLTPDEAWEGVLLPEPISIRSHDPIKPVIDIRRLKCRGDSGLPVIEITLRKAA